MPRLQYLAVPQIHVDTARQTRIEAAYSPHNVDSLELIGTVFFEDRRVLHRILVWTRGAVDIARIGVPGRWRIRMVVCDLALLNNHMMREHSANRFVEAAADGLFRHLELSPCFRVASVQLAQRFFHKVQCGAGGVDLEVSAGPIALDGVAPLGNLPLELDLRQ